MSREQLLTIVEEDVPPGFVRDAVGFLRRVYPSSYAEAYRRFGPYEAHDFLGMLRRQMIEEGLREVASRHPGVRATVETNSRRSQYFTLLRAGRLAITASRLSYPQSMPARADFRDTLNRSGQLSFLDDERERDPDTIYAVLAHGPGVADRENPPSWEAGPPRLEWSELGFAFLGVPADGVRYWAARMDLLAAAGTVAGPTAETEEIADRTMPALRLKSKSGTSGV